LSVVIPTLNVAPIIRRCLDSLTWADEVVIVDMFSTDATEAICTEYPNVRFLQNRDYIFANVNYGAERASGSWIMRLDSDEVPTAEMAAEIRDRVLSEREPQYSGYWAPSRTWFCGKPLRYGSAWDPRGAGRGYTYRKVLFRKGTARYECKREHEDLTTTGEYGTLEHPYEHYSHPTLTGWIAKMNYYTDRDAERLTEAEVAAAAGLGIRTVAWRTVRDFVSLYFRRQGYRDGAHGLAASFLYSIYPAIERLKRWERSLEREGSAAPP
jgi:glycosyltransferase involved in cell wall biosynthesis